mmetsp:Transcript_33416/g.51282  ORF Transcript_33416/g.51282 Transcript_33416/m.51282 type:complete len:125 (+) Transcript_33416:2735-3109(+)
MYEHRTEKISEFQNRIDYVNIDAYGIGAVEVGHQEASANVTQTLDQDTDINEENAIDKQANIESRLIDKIKEQRKHSDSIVYSLCALTNRQDERLNMAVNKFSKIDEFQLNLIKRVYLDEDMGY